jgi:hypothetical protein
LPWDHTVTASRQSLKFGKNLQAVAAIGSWLGPPLYNPNDNGDAQDEYRDARRQNNQPGRRQHNLIVGDMQVHSLNMRSEYLLFQPVRLPQSN